MALLSSDKVLIDGGDEALWGAYSEHFWLDRLKHHFYSFSHLLITKHQATGSTEGCDMIKKSKMNLKFKFLQKDPNICFINSRFGAVHTALPEGNLSARKEAK